MQNTNLKSKYIKDSCCIICRQFQHSPVFRIGGDEFVALLEGEDFKNREALIETFNLQMEENLHNGREVISCGMEEFDPEHDINFSNIFERADKKMYSRKRILKGIKKQDS